MSKRKSIKKTRSSSRHVNPRRLHGLIQAIAIEGLAVLVVAVAVLNMRMIRHEQTSPVQADSSISEKVTAWFEQLASATP